MCDYRKNSLPGKHEFANFRLPCPEVSSSGWCAHRALNVLNCLYSFDFCRLFVRQLFRTNVGSVWTGLRLCRKPWKKNRNLVEWKSNQIWIGSNFCLTSIRLFLCSQKTLVMSKPFENFLHLLFGFCPTFVCNLSNECPAKVETVYTGFKKRHKEYINNAYFCCWFLSIKWLIWIKLEVSR